MLLLPGRDGSCSSTRGRQYNQWQIAGNITVGRCMPPLRRAANRTERGEVGVFLHLR